MPFGAFLYGRHMRLPPSRTPAYAPSPSPSPSPSLSRRTPPPPVPPQLWHYLWAAPRTACTQSICGLQTSGTNACTQTGNVPQLVHKSWRLRCAACERAGGAHARRGLPMRARPAGSGLGFRAGVLRRPLDADAALCLCLRPGHLRSGAASKAPAGCSMGWPAAPQLLVGGLCCWHRSQ
jgi:hypothetical protein